MTTATARNTRTAIYVACLASYNAGKLHGTWIELPADPDYLWEQVRDMLTDSPVPFAEEYAIHDYEGFGPITIGEFWPLENVNKLARLIDKHGDAFAYYADDVGVDEAEQSFEDAYRGQYLHGASFASQMYDSIYGRPPNEIESFIDWEGYWKHGLPDYWIQDGHVFCSV